MLPQPVKAEGKRPEKVVPNKRDQRFVNVETEDGSRAVVHKDLAERMWPRRASIIVPELPWKREKRGEE